MTANQKVCKGHCQCKESSDIICQKREKCMNFSRADTIARKKCNENYQKIIADIY
ncbi:hypothetical protein KGV55_02730 [Candidatus Gracilibacteria bacterium]|nr:hypothetical protein [Candidatus Gracilibacteria bacterium]